MKRALTTVAATLILSACAGGPRLVPNLGFMRRDAAPGPTASPTPTTEAYLRAAGESDLYEVTSSQIALQRTQNPDVRGFALRMIDHHTMTTNTLLTAAATAQVAPPPAVLGRMRPMIEQLNGQVGFNFDRLYVQQQLIAHQEALALHSTYARSGDTPQLRAAAAATVPVVQRHLDQIQGLQARVG